MRNARGAQTAPGGAEAGRVAAGARGRRRAGLTAAVLAALAAMCGRSRAAAPVAAGSYHTCGVWNTGELYCWGANWFGMLGVGDVYDRGRPTLVNTTVNFVAVAAGFTHTCGIAEDGALWCWGSGSEGQLGRGEAEEALSPVLVDTLPVAAVDVCCGYGHTCALGDDGSVWCWGLNDQGQLGDGGSTSSFLPRRVFVMGKAPAGQLACTMDSMCAVMHTGAVVCWGNDEYGQTGASGDAALEFRLPDGGDAVEITAGDYHFCARSVRGGLYCWGDNEYGAVGTGTDVGAIRVPTQAVLPEGLAWQDVGVAAVRAGGFSSAAVLQNGSVLEWGTGYWVDWSFTEWPDSWLVRAPTLRRGDPKSFDGLRVEKLYIGGAHACAILGGREWGGRMLCRGDNAYGQLGNGRRSWGGGTSGADDDGTDDGETPIGFRPFGPLTMACPDGTVRTSALGACEMCAPGSYRVGGATRCWPCSPGHYAEDAGATSCQACPANTYSASWAASSSSACEPCARGFTSDPGSVQCTVCSSGSYVSEKSGQCEACPEGYVAAQAAATECFACLFGQRANQDRTQCLAPPIFNVVELLVAFIYAALTVALMALHSLLSKPLRSPSTSSSRSSPRAAQIIPLSSAAPILASKAPISGTGTTSTNSTNTPSTTTTTARVAPTSSSPPSPSSAGARGVRFALTTRAAKDEPLVADEEAGAAADLTPLAVIFEKLIVLNLGSHDDDADAERDFPGRRGRDDGTASLSDSRSDVGTTPTVDTASEALSLALAADRRHADELRSPRSLRDDQQGRLDRRALDRRGFDRRGLDRRGLDQGVLDRRGLDQGVLDQRALDQRALDDHHNNHTNHTDHQDRNNQNDALAAEVLAHAELERVDPLMGPVLCKAAAWAEGRARASARVAATVVRALGLYLSHFHRHGTPAHPDPSARAIAAGGLVDWKILMGFLTRSLTHRHASVRLAACDVVADVVTFAAALPFPPPRALLSNLADTLTDTDETVRVIAVEAVGRVVLAPDAAPALQTTAILALETCMSVDLSAAVRRRATDIVLDAHRVRARRLASSSLPLDQDAPESPSQDGRDEGREEGREEGRDESRDGSRELAVVRRDAHPDDSKADAVGTVAAAPRGKENSLPPTQRTCGFAISRGRAVSVVEVWVSAVVGLCNVAAVVTLLTTLVNAAVGRYATTHVRSLWSSGLDRCLAAMLGSALFSHFALHAWMLWSRSGEGRGSRLASSDESSDRARSSERGARGSTTTSRQSRESVESFELSPGAGGSGARTSGDRVAGVCGVVRDAVLRLVTFIAPELAMEPLIAGHLFPATATAMAVRQRAWMSSLVLDATSVVVACVVFASPFPTHFFVKSAARAALVLAIADVTIRLSRGFAFMSLLTRFAIRPVPFQRTRRIVIDRTSPSSGPPAPLLLTDQQLQEDAEVVTGMTAQGSSGTNQSSLATNQSSATDPSLATNQSSATDPSSVTNQSSASDPSSATAESQPARPFPLWADAMLAAGALGVRAVCVLACVEAAAGAAPHVNVAAWARTALVVTAAVHFAARAFVVVRRTLQWAPLPPASAAFLLSHALATALATSATVLASHNPLAALLRAPPALRTRFARVSLLVDAVSAAVALALITVGAARTDARAADTLAFAVPSDALGWAAVAALAIAALAGAYSFAVHAARLGCGPAARDFCM